MDSYFVGSKSSPEFLVEFSKYSAFKAYEMAASLILGLASFPKKA